MSSGFRRRCCCGGTPCTDQCAVDRNGDPFGLRVSISGIVACGCYEPPLCNQRVFNAPPSGTWDLLFLDGFPQVGCNLCFGEGGPFGLAFRNITRRVYQFGQCGGTFTPIIEGQYLYAGISPACVPSQTAELSVQVNLTHVPGGSAFYSSAVPALIGESVVLPVVGSAACNAGGPCDVTPYLIASSSVCTVTLIPRP